MPQHILPGENIHDVLQYMRAIIQDEAENSEAVKALAGGLGGLSMPDLLRITCDFFYKTVTFEPDAPTLQKIKTVRRLLQDGRGNCVNYTVAIASVMTALGYPVVIRAVQLPGTNYFGHVYPVVDGIVCDVVPDQLQDGQEHLHRGVNNFFNGVGKELDFLHKFDLSI